MNTNQTPAPDVWFVQKEERGNNEKVLSLASVILQETCEENLQKLLQKL